MSKMAKQLGRRGGLARSRKLPPAERERIARLAAETRWLSEKADARLLANLRYLRAVQILRKIPQVKNVSRLAGPLPGVYGQSGR